MEKYFDIYCSVNRPGYELYYTDGDTVVHVGHFDDIEMARERAFKDGYVIRPLYVRF